MSLLEGARVLEFGHVWSGPYCAQVMADLGAEVIRIESMTHVDVHRRAGPYPQATAGINRSGVWNAQNRGKLSCRLNLKTAEGKALAMRLVEASHAVIENMAPGVMDRLGLSFADLKRVNPKLVMVSLSGYGQAGPWYRYPAYGPMLDAVAGVSWAARSDDGVPQSVNGWLPDTTAALYGAVAAIHGLAEAPTKGGALFDIAQLESAMSLFPELIALASLDLPDPSGANLIPGAVGFTLPCAGDDIWIAVVAESEECWRRLQDVLGVEQPTPLAAASSSAALLATRSALRGRDALAAELQAAGVEAVPVLAADELLTDADLRGRNAFATLDHAEVGPIESYAPVVSASDWTPPARTLPAPLLGEHDAYVFETVLGLSRSERHRLESAGVIA
jgi:benzylsuccinate CoA-transferase BbsF subunit